MGDVQIGVTSPAAGTWVQTDRAAHEKWALLAVEKPRAAAILHVMVAKMGRHNALVVSQKTLAKLCRCSRATLQRSLDVLRVNNWIDVRQIGPTGTANAYVINDRVAWSGARDGIRFSLFSAAVIISDLEQPDIAELGSQPSLEQFPELFIGEVQFPSGPGLDPPSEPSIPGLEVALPFIERDDK